MKRLTIAALLALLVWVAGVSAQSGFLVNGIQQLVSAVTVTATSAFLAPTGCTTVPYSFTGRTTDGLCSSGVGQLDLYSGGVDVLRLFSSGRISSVASGQSLNADGSISGVANISIGNSNSYGWAAGDVCFGRSGTKAVTFNDCAGGAATFAVTGAALATTGFQLVEGAYYAFASTTGGSNKSRLGAASHGQWTFEDVSGATRGYTIQSVSTAPTCTSNCGTSPSVSGSDSSLTVTMGATGTPTSGFVIAFGGTWSAAPQCIPVMAKAGMAVGKMVLTAVTTTTTITAVTNGTDPANGDKYTFHCSLGS